jgi:hypothetical protein
MTRQKLASELKDLKSKVGIEKILVNLKNPQSQRAEGVLCSDLGSAVIVKNKLIDMGFNSAFIADFNNRSVFLGE